ncbi:MAG: isoprenyl transferase [Paracoccaceae bacterium]
MHVGIIMDGNGRWATEKGLPRSLGHRKGASKVSEIIKSCPDLNIDTLTLYAFSTENWSRAAHEVESLMRLFRGYMQSKFLQIINNNIKVKFLGDSTDLPKEILFQMKKLEKQSSENNGFFLNIALNYGGRNEILRATKNLIEDVTSLKISKDQVNEDLFNNYLDTMGQPDPDLIIRTAGEKRLSNFLLWQSTYSELYFTDEMWPDFTPNSLKKALDCYYLRTRKFGSTSIDKNAKIFK